MRKHLTLAAVIFVVLVLFPVKSSWGWIDAGHKITALLAWQDLTPATRSALADLLKQHPRYEKDLLTDLPEGATAEETARHAFAVASTWPDIVRSQAHPMRAAHNHPIWHYINIPFEDGAAADSSPTSRESGAGNVVEALAQCVAELKDGATPADKKAIDICWIAHLVGDIHQPLHAARHYSPQFPTGDAGGNYAIVLRDPPYPDSKTNLHLLWDSLPGNYRSQFIDRYVAAGLRGDPDYSRDHFKSVLGKIDFSIWANESHAIAVEHVYLNGKLEVAASRRDAPTTQPIPGLPPDYLKQAEPIAMQRVALGGYRLADLLNSIFDPKP